LYARRAGGTVILRIDDTDLERNTEESLNSIFNGLKWLDLGWDEQYRQSERLDRHRAAAAAVFSAGFAYRDFAPARAEDEVASGGEGGWLFNPGMRELSREESDRRAARGQPFVLRFRVPRDVDRAIEFSDLVFGPQSKRSADIEDFALLRSNGMPTYHMASCADDVELRITDIIRGQDHLTNTFKHVLIFEALGAQAPKFAHLPLLIAPDGAKLSKRKHGPVVSVTTYRDGGFLPHAFVNFLCLLGWNPKDNREQMTRQELLDAFSIEGVNRSNAVINFTEEDAFDPKAVWLNAQHIYALPVEELASKLVPFFRAAGFVADEQKILRVTPLIRERIRLLTDAAAVADFFFLEQLPPYDPLELVPQKGDAAMALRALERAREVLAGVDFTHQALEPALRHSAVELGMKTGQMFQPIRVAVCGRKNAPPLFETLQVLGRETCLKRIEEAIRRLRHNRNV
jgi:glutamyl-tRNA synthetase